MQTPWRDPGRVPPCRAPHVLGLCLFTTYPYPYPYSYPYPYPYSYPYPYPYPYPSSCGVSPPSSSLVLYLWKLSSAVAKWSTNRSCS